MLWLLQLLVWCLALALAARASDDDPGSAPEWTIYVTNDDCPDYTWGFVEEQTRQNLADIVAGHLDEINRTDGDAWENQDRYNMCIALEALCLVERYPERKDELIRRVKEGRIHVSPYLCNSLWGFQSFEGAIRTLYPARRLELEWGVPMDVAEHIECPSLPWGTASILAGCGIRWLSNPFLNFDSTFAQLENPPVFIYQGPDGAEVRVVMDPWACNRWGYVQGGRGILQQPDGIATQWIPRYESLGEEYPLKAVLASGTHGDTMPWSGRQAREFADAIRTHNSSSERPAKLVNALLSDYCRAVDEAQSRTPFLKVLRGCFGHSWDLWPVSLAKYAAEMRANEQLFMAAEALVAAAALKRPELSEATRVVRERAEWCWAMLSDHAWNGTDPDNRRLNAELRRHWNAELNQISVALLKQMSLEKPWQKPDERQVTIFNALSFPRKDLVRLDSWDAIGGLAHAGTAVPTQLVEEDGRRTLYALLAQIPAFSTKTLNVTAEAEQTAPGSLRATATELESPFYRLVVDTKTGGVSSLIHKASGAELVAGDGKRTLCQTVYHDGRESRMRRAKSEVVATGPLLARLRVTGVVKNVEITNYISVYAELDRVDFDLRLHKPITTQEERLCQIFPVAGEGAALHVETTAAVLVPKRQPEGDLLPGADTRRMVVQGFVDVSSPRGPGVTIAPVDSFALRLDLDSITFEALGNDQNYQEVVSDQDGVTDFRFRYAVQGHAHGYDKARAVAWSRTIASPLLVLRGPVSEGGDPVPVVEVDPKRAIATCLKPADRGGSGTIVRLWEVSGQSGPVTVHVPGFSRAVRTDLLERDQEELSLVEGSVRLHLPAHGFGSIRLLI